MPTDFQGYNDPTGISDLTAAALHSLVSGSFATLTEYDNSTAGNLNPYGDFELLIAAGANLTDGTLSDLYLLIAMDGTNYSDTGGPPSNLYVGSFRHAAANPNRVYLRDVALPLLKFKPYLKYGGGVNTSASGSHLKMFPKRQQGTTV
jgi:hypothetical protein